jgi:hypothetical protein
VLSVFPDGNENAHDPRVLITPLDRKKAFIRFRQEWVPKDGKAVRTDIYKSRFLDLRTLVGAEFGKPLSLKAACEMKAFEKFNLPRKSDYMQTGRVTGCRNRGQPTERPVHGSSAQCRYARV